MQRTHVIALAGLLAVVAAQPAMAVISTQDQVNALHFFLNGTGAAVAQLGVPSPGLGAFPDPPGAYLDERGNLWEESNGVPGLQTHAVEQGGRIVAPADSFVGGLDTLTRL